MIPTTWRIRFQVHSTFSSYIQFLHINNPHQYHAILTSVKHMEQGHDQHMEQGHDHVNMFAH